VSFTILIPARLASTRLPNKPLADIAGKPMVVRVAECVACAGATRVVVAADSPLIVQACQNHSVAAVLTRTDHASGSDRLAEACDLLGLQDQDIVVNVQGDEPLMPPELVSAVAQLLMNTPQASISTAAHAIDSLTDFQNPNVVKVVCDQAGLAHYFSRSPIPYPRDTPDQLPQPAPLRHIGIYGYRVGFLRQFPKLAQAHTELAESLEQLRAMWHGYRIAVHITTQAPGPGVDTPADLARVRQLFGT
jgi:3-deoxy-manno-octulosonate cytidylyltransferase (CMP-KDO synthetase)